ncbi:MAG: hypothetical protein LKF43_00455 [Streptococcaceae bacterium]|jgi:hypothetical protein|nr:hypothetical protein [Streptococcaceae bacterium]
MNRQARMANTPEDYKKLKLKKEIKPWEDGLRSSPEGENFEWWYFDAHLEDGSDLVIIFYSKSATHPTDGWNPNISVTLNRPDGTKINDTVFLPADQFSSSTTSADVKIGDNYFRGDLNHYEIQAATENVDVHVSFDNITPAWRPETGVIYFGDQDEDYFSWLPATPRGDARVTLKINGVTSEVDGQCYHDHNWGNASMMSLLHHWYWGRANIGDYTVINSEMISEKKYGYKPFTIFLVAKGDEILADDISYVKYEEKQLAIDETTKKPFHKEITYNYNDGKKHYKISYLWKETILQEKMVDQLPKLKKIAAEIAGFDGAYLRFKGKVKLEIFENDKVTEVFENEAIWEEVYFGKTLK